MPRLTANGGASVRRSGVPAVEQTWDRSACHRPWRRLWPGARRRSMLGANSPRWSDPSEDVILRRAAFLVVMNGDPSKPEIAFGQQYFAVATRTSEVIQSVSPRPRACRPATVDGDGKPLPDRASMSAMSTAGHRPHPQRGRCGAVRRQGYQGDEGAVARARQRPLAILRPRSRSLPTAGDGDPTHNVRANESLRGEGLIAVEHVGTTTVHKAVKARGIDLGTLPAKDIRVERRHATEVRELAKPAGQATSES